MQPCLYSPLPVDSYIIPGLERTAVSTTKVIARGATIWNMMWLSYPMLDKIPGAGKDWHLVYKSNPELFAAIVSDVNIYDDLHFMLHQHPAKFAAWFAKEDHSAWVTYKVGGAGWVAMVLARAEEAAVRLASQVEIQGNVVRVKFGGKRDPH
jgi:hypothetical protein